MTPCMLYVYYSFFEIVLWLCFRFLSSLCCLKWAILSFIFCFDFLMIGWGANSTDISASAFIMCKNVFIASNKTMLFCSAIFVAHLSLSLFIYDSSISFTTALAIFFETLSDWSKKLTAALSVFSPNSFFTFCNF